MLQPVLYGISNCDTVKKARKWLEQQSINYIFHDFRKDGLTGKELKNWLTEIGQDVLINKRSTTWRTLPEADKKNLSQANAIKLMLANPTLIKRPVLVSNNHVIVGFNPAEYKNQLGK